MSRTRSARAARRDLFPTLPLAAALLLAACAAALAPPAAGAAQPGDELVVLTWSEYMDPEIVAEFEAQSGAKVRFVYFETDDVRTDMLGQDDGKGFDLALVSGASLDAYVRRGWVEPLASVAVPNLRHLDPRWVDAFPGAARHGVPYFWGTLGIGFRRDLYPEGFTSWKQLFEPAEALRGKIVMIGANRDLVGMALKSLGHSANSEDRDALKAVGELLQRQKPFVRNYTYVSLGERSVLVTGEAVASMIYSGDALALREHDANIEYVVPEEGGNLWVDYFTILSASQRKPLAAAFVDFLNRPEIAARNAEYVYYATPNLAAKAHLPAEYFANPVIYPEESVLARSEIYAPIKPRTQKRVNAVMASVVN